MQTIEQLRELFLTYLKDNHISRSPEKLYQPVNYIMELGGKRMRPIMLLMAYQLFDDVVKKGLPAAYAIEMFHNFSLVHDDIMDEAPLRRGKPTVHSAYDINTGILSGDVMLILAYKYLLETENPAIIKDLVALFNETSILVCEGQQMDMDFETMSTVQIDEYIRMISYKTAALLAGGMKMGALIAGANLGNAERVYDFAWNIGIAFQLQDDILDTYGDPEKFGKKVGGDIVQNKKTYLVLRALELATPEIGSQLAMLMNSPTENEALKIAQVKGIFDQLDVRKEAEQLKADYQEKAFLALDRVEVSADRKAPLIEIARQLIGREV